MAAAMKHMASNFAKLEKFEGVDFQRWQKKMHFLLSRMSVVMLKLPKNYGIPWRPNIWAMGEDASSKKFLDDDVAWAAVRLHVPKLKTLGESGIECIFVGYAEHSKAFRTLNHETKNIVWFSGPLKRVTERFVKMDDPNITMEEYIRLEEEKTRRRAIVFNDTLTSEALLCEPTVSSLNDEIDFRISFDESDDED
ncbi:hypothetical protein Tco_0987928 [Tanacetum coccineum]